MSSGHLMNYSTFDSVWLLALCALQMHNDDDDDLMVLWLPFGLVEKDNFIDFMVRNVPGVSLPYPTTLTDDVANWKARSC